MLFLVCLFVLHWMIGREYIRTLSHITFIHTIQTPNTYHTGKRRPERMGESDGLLFYSITYISEESVHSHGMPFL